MRIKAVKNNKKGHPKSITVQMSIDEAGVIAKTFGEMSYNTFKAKFPRLNDAIHSEIYGCLTGELFNKTWDDGVEDWLRGKAPNYEGL